MLEPPESPHDLGQVQPVVHFDDEIQGGVTVVAVFHAHVDDIGFLVRDGGCNRRQHPALVGDVDPDIGGELLVYTGFPFNISNF